MSGERYLANQDGTMVRAYLALREQGGANGRYGPSAECRTLIFETCSGAWLGSIVVSTPDPIHDFTDEDLRVLLQFVRYLELHERGRAID